MIVESGKITRSTDEWLMSRSCHSATFSSAASALVRTRRARPQIRSASSGLRLCGMALEPFWPSPKGSRASSTSVRWSPRTSRAIFSSEAAATASIAQNSASVALDDLRGDRCGVQAELAAHRGFEVGLDVGEVPHGTRELADGDRRARPAQPLEVAPGFGVPDRDLETEAGGLGVDAVRPADRERVLVANREVAEHLAQPLLTRDQE